jgi:hypothetical protein
MKKTKKKSLAVKGQTISIFQEGDVEYISLTDMLKAKDGDFFIADWLRNRNTVEFLGIWESVFNPDFNYGEFAIIRSQAGLNNYKISVKEWVEKTKAIGLNAVFVRQGLSSSERLMKLNEVAITQMRTLLSAQNAKRLKQC